MGRHSAQRIIATPLHNEEIAAAFDEMADLLDIQGESIFRVRAYRRAALVIRTLPRQLAEMHGVEEFDALPGIGPDLAAKIGELLRTGHLRALDIARRKVPPGVRELLTLPALGPVRVRALLTGLRVRGVEDLRRALDTGKVAGLRGFGPKIRAGLSEALAQKGTNRPQRVPFSVATEYARPLEQFLESLPGVSRVEVAGSYRRGRDTIGDLDVLVCASRSAKPISALSKYGELSRLTAAGTT